MNEIGKLARLLKESGPSCLQSVLHFKQLLRNNQITTLQPKEVSTALIYMARTSSDPIQAASLWGSADNGADKMAQGYQWDISNFVAVVEVDWMLVYESFDVPEFFIGDQRAFEVVIKAYAMGTSDAEFPMQLFYKKWSNIKGQTSFLRWSTQTPREVIDLAKLSKKPVLTAQSLVDVPAGTRNIVNGWLVQPWNCVELISILMHLACEEKEDDAKQLLDIASRQCTELVLLGLIQVDKPWHQLHAEVVKKLVTVFALGHSSSVFVLGMIWQLDRQVLIDVLVDLHSQDAQTVSRILDIATELKAVPVLLESSNLDFAVDLAALAYQRDFINLQAWLSDRIKSSKEYVGAVLKFLRAKLSGGSDGVALNNSVYVAIFTALFEATLSASELSQLQELQLIAGKTIPAVAQLHSKTQESAFGPDIEQIANLNFEKIYTGELTVSSVVAMLQKFRTSKSQKDQDVYASMLHNLFDEYRFFPKYPDKELLITGELYGQLIKEKVVTQVRVATALKHIAEALKSPSSSKMFRFGLTALNQFRAQLNERPQFCNQLLSISHLVEGHPDIAALLKQSAVSDSPAMVKRTLNTDTLTTNDQVATPSDAIQDKILFILNNLSVDNLNEKSSEMKQVLGESLFPWFTQYLVVKRVCTEPNYHQLYLMLLDAIKSKSLDFKILQQTYQSINVLIASEKTVASSSERSLLKNLGAWLGQLTLSRNKAIKDIDLSLKQLLIEGYKASRLLVVIPFVCKVVEQSKSSQVFRPPNPWLMAILKLLAELYHNAELKLNLKFEIEVLCKTIDVELKNIPSANLLFSQQVHQHKMVQGFQQLGLQELHPQGVEVLQQSDNTTPMVVTDEHGNANFPNLEEFVVFSSNTPLFNAHPALKKLVVIAIDRAIKEVVGPVVERSVSIASVATRELVTKDFANEGNEMVLTRAAMLMAQNLSGSLALVTSKDPFVKCLTVNLQTALQQSGVAEPMSEVIISTVVPENADLGCRVVRKAAMDKASRDISSVLQQDIVARRRQRERGMPWMDQQPSVAALPVGLRHNASNQIHQQVYEAFAEGADTLSVPQVAVVKEEPANPLDQIMDKLTALLDELDNIVSQHGTLSLNTLPQEHAIIVLVRQINVAASQFYVRDELALWFAQKLSQLLFSSTVDLGLEIYIVLLERICELSKAVAREFAAWLYFSPEESKLNVNVHVALIQSGLLNIKEVDVNLSQYFLGKNVKLIKFGLELIEKLLVGGSVTVAEVFGSIKVLNANYSQQSLPSELHAAFATVISKAAVFLQAKSPAYVKKQSEALALLDAWAEVYDLNDRSLTQVVPQIKAMDLLTDDNAMVIFVRMNLDALVAEFKIKSVMPGSSLTVYHKIDALCALIAYLIQNFVAHGQAAKVALLSKVLSTVSLVMVHEHQLARQVFDSRPYFRTLLSIIDNMLAVRNNSEQYTVAIMEVFSNALLTIAPQSIPVFSFSWLELVSHRKVMPVLLSLSSKKGWNILHKLLQKLFSFLAPFLRHAEMTDPIRVMYKGTLRVLLVLLHDYPEFLSEYQFAFCQVLPPSCIQLRNLLLSAFPREIVLPDPFTRNLKVDMLPEIAEFPEMSQVVELKRMDSQLNDLVDAQLSDKIALSFIDQLKTRLALNPEDIYLQGSAYNIPLINCLTLHVGNFGIKQMQRGGLSVPSSKSSSMDLFQKLADSLDTEGRYHLLNAIANHLRYPNAHSHYFSCILLTIFADSSSEAVKEQITRVLLERLIVNRPHPWALLITFIELLKNPRYKFWSHDFTRCAPDIERLFESVARSCMIPMDKQ